MMRERDQRTEALAPDAADTAGKRAVSYRSRTRSTQLSPVYPFLSAPKGALLSALDQAHLRQLTKRG